MEVLTVAKDAGYNSVGRGPARVPLHPFFSAGKGVDSEAGRNCMENVRSAMVIVVAGVSGSGKTTVGRRAAARLGWRFCDADDLHDQSSIERIRRGQPLDDELRGPWLARVRETIETAISEDVSLVIACSALKESYRRHLSEGLSDVRFVFLAGDRQLLLERLSARQGHFAGPLLLDSQLATFEPAGYGLHLDAADPLDALVDAVVVYATKAADEGGRR